MLAFSTVSLQYKEEQLEDLRRLLTAEQTVVQSSSPEDHQVTIEASVNEISTSQKKDIQPLSEKATLSYTSQVLS